MQARHIYQSFLHHVIKFLNRNAFESSNGPFDLKRAQACRLYKIRRSFLNRTNNEAMNIQKYNNASNIDPLDTKIKEEGDGHDDNLNVLTIKQEPTIQEGGNVIEASNTYNIKQELRKLEAGHSIFIKHEEFDVKNENSDYTSNLTSSNQKILSCAFCDYKCSWKSRLTDHVKTHTGEKPFQCSFCQYKCVKKENLTRHRKTHTGEKSLSCPSCDYKCLLKSSLVYHQKTHTGEKPFECAFCDYKCILKTGLTRHLTIHSGEKTFKCHFCDYKSTEKTKLTCHLRIHTGEKLFKCTSCEYKSPDKRNFTRHMTTHTGEKPFVCGSCEYRTAVNSSLKRHMKIHTDKMKP